MTRIDPFELLRRLNPVPHEQYTDADESMLARIVARPVSPPRTSRKRLWLAAGGAGAVVLATAAWSVLHSAEASDPRGIACHAEASLEGAVVGVQPAADPRAACEDAWRSGAFGDQEVPEALQACVGPQGAAAVYPGGAEVCSRLGLALLEPTVGPESGKVARLQELVNAAFPVDACVDEATARGMADGLVDEVGLEEWTVHVAGTFSAALPCAAVGVDAEGQALVVTGRPRPSTQ